jgi:hypothetical protein
MPAPELSLQLCQTKHCNLSNRLSFPLSVLVYSFSSRAGMSIPAVLLARTLDVEETTDQAEQ